MAARAIHPRVEIGRHVLLRGRAQPDAFKAAKLPHPALAFRAAASEASRFLAASSSRAEPSRARAFSARRCSLR
jgi:hypothetical protein